MVKQKQTQKVVINIGEAKPKRRRRAPTKKAPKAGTQARPGGGGGGGGGVPPQLAQPGDFFPRAPPTVILPNRAGPVVESTASIQQLVKPLEQALLLLRPPTQPVPQALPAPKEAESKEERIPKQLTMQDVRDYMMRQFEQLPIYREEQESYAATPPIIESGAATPSLFVPQSKSLREYLSEMSEVREMETQTEEKRLKELPSTGTQVQIVEPEPALVSAGQRPLVDAVVQPSEAAKPAVSQEEEVEFPAEIYTKDDIRQLDREQKITKSFLDQFVVKKKSAARRKPGQATIDLLDIGRALGLRFEQGAQGAPKQEIIDFILENKGDPIRASTFYRK